MLWVAVTVMVLVIWAYSSRRRDPPDPIDQLPGPNIISILGTLMILGQMTLHKRFQISRIQPKLYGFRFLFKLLGARWLNIINPEDIESILSHSRNITKGHEYQYFFALFGDGLIKSKGKKWFQRRKMLSPTFHFSVLNGFVTLMAKRGVGLVGHIAARAQADGPEMEVYPIVSQATLHMICETAMGTELDEKKHEVTKMVKAANDIHKIIVRRILSIWLRSNFIFNRTALSKQLEICSQELDSFVHNIIEERKERTGTVDDEQDSKRRLAMLDLVLDAEKKGLIDYDGVHEEVKTFILGGYGTTSLAVTFGIMLLADHKDVQDRIYEECRRIFGDSNRSPSMSDLAEMKYLDAVIKETLRIYPTVPIILRQVTEDFMMGDLSVRKGVQVVVQIYDLHHREDLYPEPEAFKPERFLDGAPMHPFAFIPFSAGPRNCIGQRYAMLEMKCLLSEIVRHFELAPKTKGWRPSLYSALLMHPYEPIHVKFISRK